MSVTDRILGESTPRFSDQFKGILELMRSIDRLVYDWWKYDLHDETSHSRWVKRLQIIIKEYEKKYGRSSLTKSLHTQIDSNKEDEESLSFWNRIQYVLVLKTREFILSGQISVDDEDSAQKLVMSGDIMNDPNLLKPEVGEAIKLACNMIDEYEIQDIMARGTDWLDGADWLDT
jgi:hypothetical protein